jgi:hypothetical protein
MPQKDLAAAWLKITGDSHIVDIRFVRSPDRVAAYITKYASKPLTGEVARDPDALDEAVTALAGRRLCTTFGLWRGIPLLEPPEDGEWFKLGTLNDFLDRALNGDTYAMDVLAKVDKTRADVALAYACSRSPPDGHTSAKQDANVDYFLDYGPRYDHGSN